MILHCTLELDPDTALRLIRHAQDEHCKVTDLVVVLLKKALAQEPSAVPKVEA